MQQRLGQVERAHSIALGIDLKEQSNAFKERTLQAIAMCKRSLKVPSEEIIAAAEACRRVNPRGRISLSARYIIVSNEQSQDRNAQLRTLYDEARKKGVDTVANNIALDLAKTSTSSEQKMQFYKSILENGRDKDHYNFVRALLQSTRLSFDETGVLTSQQFDDCVRAYSYLYNQRIDNLFESCHRILWDVFEMRGDVKNLLTLYRHSSLVWRLHRKTEIEKKYQIALAKILGSRLSGSILAADRELRYYISRSASSTSELPNPLSHPTDS